MIYLTEYEKIFIALKCLFIMDENLLGKPG